MLYRIFITNAIFGQSFERFCGLIQSNCFWTVLCLDNTLTSKFRYILYLVADVNVWTCVFLWIITIVGFLRFLTSSFHESRSELRRRRPSSCSKRTRTLTSTWLNLIYSDSSSQISRQWPAKSQWNNIRTMFNWTLF